MSTFILIPGAGGSAWYWNRVTPDLIAAGHEAIAVDLPGDDETSGLEAYADIVLNQADGRSDIVLVAQSMGAFTAARVMARVDLGGLVFVNAMIPEPGETAGEWWGATGWEEARIAAARARGYDPEFDVETYFLHDVPAETVRESAAHVRPEAKIAFTEPCRFERWPDVPIHVIVGAGDRFFPADFQKRVARERLPARAKVEELPGGHLIALSNPEQLAARLSSYERRDA
jgi:pimeloyl-ACP methyl ester carboxylesterase